jgi:hypothetical protein
MAEKHHNGITKAQRKKLAKEKKRAAKKQAKRKQAIFRWSIRSVIVLLLLITGYVGYAAFLQKPDVSNKGILRVASPEYNFGTVSVRGGIVSTRIPLVNIGEGDLTITALDSSCGCTTASIINDGVEGPIFQMASQSRNPKNWHTIINLGEQAFLKVYYNPAVHPNLRGPITRIVTIYSDD